MPEFASVFDLDDIDGQNGLKFLGAAGSDDFARASAGAGDINGDGLADLIFGARDADLGGSGRGAAYVVFGDDGGFGALDAANGAADGVIDIGDLNGANGFRVTGSYNNGLVGISVGAAGDVDGDGFDDVIIGQQRITAIFNSPGSASLLFGKANGFAASVSINPGGAANGYWFVGQGTNSNDDTGYSVSGAGDVNGDGFADLLIGARNDDVVTGVTNGNEGAAYLVFGGDANLVDLDNDDGITNGVIALSNVTSGKGAVFTGQTTNANSRAGKSVHTAGDVNGDGFADFIIGSPNADPNSGVANSSEGAAYLVFGRPDAVGFNSTNLPFLNGVQGVVIEGVSTSDQLGNWVSGGGDVNGDGLDDVIVAAARADQHGASSTGSAYVIFGKSTWQADFDPASLNGTNGFRADGLRSADYSGISVSMAGDLNGDGFEDVAIGAHFFDQLGATSAGAVYVVFGKADGFAPVIDLGALDGDDGFRVDGPNQTSAILGRGMSGPAGDINGDGFDDLVMGAYREDTVNGVNSGAGYVLFGHKAEGSVHRIGTHLSQTQNGGLGDDLIEGNDGDDTLIGWEGDDVIMGGAGADTLVGAAGFDVLSGGSGDDLIGGGAGGDEIDGGSGIDMLSYLGATTGVTLNMTWNSGTGGDAAGDVFTRMEGVIGSNLADAIHGDQGVNTLRGEGGNDMISARGGADMVLGGEGNDDLQGGAGFDMLFGGGGTDLARYSGSMTGVTVHLGATVQLGGDAQGDRLFSIENLLGSIHNDMINGDAGPNMVHGGRGDDTVHGGMGDDVVIGGAGVDTLIGGAGADDFQVFGGGVDSIIGFTTLVDDVDFRFLHLSPGQVSLTANGGDTSITGPGGLLAILVGVLPGAIDPAQDFIF